MNHEDLRVAKSGGTSMTDPEQVAHQLEQPGNEAAAIAVSAPGIDQAAGFIVKVTDMLRDYQAQPNQTKQQAIQERYAHTTSAIGGGRDVQRVVDDIPNDLAEWSARGAPLDALGEYWAAKQFAAYTGREFVDASRLIRIGNRGAIDIANTIKNIRQEINPRRQSVVPGYYGLDAHGNIRLLDRGGSDITGAILALGIGADTYDNWSDVPGFMTADPRMVLDARLNPSITYREARELGVNGSQLLHPAVIQLLGNTGIRTRMRQTQGEADALHTVITDERDWQQRPITGVTGRCDVTELSLHQYGINEASGTTAELYQWLRSNNIAYTHAATGTDDVSLFFVGNQADHLREHAASLEVPSGGKIHQQEVGLVHVVGEGLAQSGVARSRTVGKVMLALADANIESLGSTDVSQSASLTIFTRPEPAIVRQAIIAAHETLTIPEK